MFNSYGIMTKQEQKIAETVCVAWIRFARTGNPNISSSAEEVGVGNVVWPYYADNGNVMVFEASSFRIENGNSFRRAYLDFYEIAAKL